MNADETDARCDHEIDKRREREMRLVKCDGCPTQIDTDDDPDCFDSEGQAWCEPCRGRHFAEGRELAAEHHRDLNAQGCTCQWIGGGNDPDAHIKRDADCPMHGRDPDAARDDRADQ